MIDLRSDTITRPTPEMREAMAAAPVDDDVLGHDPTVLALEERTAAILGHEAALYMPSGTMTNQVAMRTHTEPGDELILDANAHVAYYEGGAPAALSGLMCRYIPVAHGIFTVDEFEAVLRPSNMHFPRSTLLSIENTHNRGGGRIWPLGQLREVVASARDHGLACHLDGARLWNAAIATGIPEAEIAQLFDSVSVCFSKGLGAPVGSALAGSTDFIERARRFRKQFGGGMRQAGIIAAGALYALEHHRDRLGEDHANARRLAEGLADLPGIEVDLAGVQTNMVFFDIADCPAPVFQAALAAHDLLVLATGPKTIRAVTSLAVEQSDIEQALSIIQDCRHA